MAARSRYMPATGWPSSTTSTPNAAHRRRGLARLIMDTIHAWCRDAGITSVALNASEDGRPLYESMGYQVAPSPMMFLTVAFAGYNSAASDLRISRSAQVRQAADQSDPADARLNIEPTETREHAIHHHRPVY